MDLKEELKNKRSNLSDGSIKTYTSILKSIHKKVFPEQEMKMSNFEKSREILEYLKDVPANKRKTILSALVVLTNNDDYRDCMNDDVKTYNDEIQKQEMTDTQRDNWITTDEIRAIYTALEDDAKMLFRKSNKTNSDIQQIQNYVIVSLCSGLFFPPRRSLDWCLMKIKNVDKNEDNYIDKSKFVFNKYKTSKTYGQQELPIPIQVKNILNRWIALNETEHLLHDNNGNALTSVKLNQRLNRIFGGKKIGSSMLRHSYLTDKYAETSRKNKELEKDMSEMGSSQNVARNYIKLDAPK
jgi:integrase